MEEGVRIPPHNDSSTDILSITASGDASMGEKPSSDKRGWRFYAALGVICLVNVVTALDASIVSAALPVSSTPGWFQQVLSSKIKWKNGKTCVPLSYIFLAE
jgi:hypothetical protein